MSDNPSQKMIWSGVPTIFESGQRIIAMRRSSPLWSCYREYPPVEQQSNSDNSALDDFIDNKMNSAYRLYLNYTEGKIFQSNINAARDWLSLAYYLGHPLAIEAIRNRSFKGSSNNSFKAPSIVEPYKLDITIHPEGGIKTIEKKKAPSISNRTFKTKNFSSSQFEHDAKPKPRIFPNREEKLAFSLGFRVGSRLLCSIHEKDSYRNHRSKDLFELSMLSIKSKCEAYIETEHGGTKLFDILREFVRRKKIMASYRGSLERLNFWLHEGAKSGIDRADFLLDIDRENLDLSDIIDDACSQGFRLHDVDYVHTR